MYGGALVHGQVENAETETEVRKPKYRNGSTEMEIRK